MRGLEGRGLVAGLAISGKRGSWMPLSGCLGGGIGRGPRMTLGERATCVSKATVGAPLGPPKAKHVRRLLVEAWESGTCASALCLLAMKMGHAKGGVQQVKVCLVMHRLLLDGPPSASLSLSPSLRGALRAAANAPPPGGIDAWASLARALAEVLAVKIEAHEEFPAVDTLLAASWAADAALESGDKLPPEEAAGVATKLLALTDRCAAVMVLRDGFGCDASGLLDAAVAACKNEAERCLKTAHSCLLALEGTELGAELRRHLKASATVLSSDAAPASAREIHPNFVATSVSSASSGEDADLQLALRLSEESLAEEEAVRVKVGSVAPLIDIPECSSPREPAVVEITFSSIQLERKVGSGAFGDVLRGVHCGEPVAVKVLGDEAQMTLQRRAEQLAEFHREVRLLSALDHPCIVRLRGACLDPFEPLAIVMEFCERGSLYHALQRRRERMGGAAASGCLLPPWLQVRLALEIASGMQYLHEQGVAHRDLKSPNILIDANWHARVADFGLSKVSAAPLGTQLGTWAWMAPEVLSSTPYGPSADVYSFGICLWEIVHGLEPFKGLGPLEIVNRVTRLGHRPEAGSRAMLLPCEDFARLIHDCWADNKDVRPTFRDCVHRLSLMSAEVLQARA